MNLFRDFERKIDDKLRRLFGANTQAEQGRELIEIQRMVLDSIEDRIQNLPRARRVFPYNDISVRIPVANEDRRVAAETVFVADDALHEEIVEAFRRDGVEFPRELQVHVTLVETQELSDPLLTFRRTEPDAAGAPDVSTTAAVPRTFRLVPLPSGEPLETSRSRIQIGRVAEVLDDRRRPVRRNDLVLDYDTVSRAHAHIEYQGGECRLFDDGSSYGTSVVQGGKLTEVPRGGGRGVLLHAGDEVYFGQARVRFEC